MGAGADEQARPTATTTRPPIAVVLAPSLAMMRAVNPGGHHGHHERLGQEGQSGGDGVEAQDVLEVEHADEERAVHAHDHQAADQARTQQAR